MRELFNNQTPFKIDWGPKGEYIIATLDPDHQYVIQELLTQPTTSEVVSVDEAIQEIKNAIDVACDDMDCLRQIILEQYPMDNGRAVVEAEVDDDNEWVTLYYETNDEDDPKRTGRPLSHEPPVRKAG